MLLGSAKSNFGHAEPPPGALGFVKAVLELQHGAVPSMVHFHRMPESWPRSRPDLLCRKRSRRGRPDTATSAAHRRVVVRSLRHQRPRDRRAGTADRERGRQTSPESPAGANLFVLSSTSADELRRTADRLTEWLERQPDPVCTHRPGLHPGPSSRTPHRARRRDRERPSRSCAPGLQDIVTGDAPFPAKVGQDDRGPVWVFSGQGSQWAAHGRRAAGDRTGVRRHGRRASSR